ncbi:TonB-dependent receptor [Flavihumibacter petaseus]|uniref:TonB-dependent receptor n=1 Tax=Flavihumibacter petaseus TaxID=549295 RepID=UPI000A4A42A2|nr:TonB-dependent receptor [Flavihumibacter petaseus]
MIRSSLLLTLLIFLSCLGAAAQTTISGKLTDTRGRAIPNASISIKDSYDGATSDSTGHYRFVTSETGARMVTVSCIGYNPYEKEITLNNQQIDLNIQVREAANELKAVVVTAGSFEASDSKRTTVLTSLDIVTTASANADVTAALRTLPGTQQIGEKEGLFIRGGSGEEARVFIDGTLVNNFFYSPVPDIAQRGRFSPFLFKGTIFSSGGYSALYGQALSGALILETIDLPEKTSANIGIHSVGGTAGYQHLNKKKNASWGVNYAYTNLWAYFQLVKQRVDYFRVPEFQYADGNFRIKTSKTGMLKGYATFQGNQLGLRSTDVDSLALKNAFTLKNHNIYFNLSWKESLSRSWRIYIGSSYSTNKDNYSNELQNQDNERQEIDEIPYSLKNYTAVLKGNLTTLKTVLEHRFRGLSAIRFGGEYLYFHDDMSFADTLGRHNVMNDRFTAAFAETDIYITNNLAAKLGTRFEHSSLLDRSNIVPRLSIAYKLGSLGQASFAYGLFFQKPEKNQLIVSQTLGYAKASHYIFNLQKVTSVNTLRIEAFYKKYDDLVKTYPGLNNSGYGYAKGVELFWRDKKTFKGVDYWVSYSFLDTKRDYLNYPYSIQPNFAANHTASLVIKKLITKWKTNINGSYSFATGRPYYDIAYNSGASKFEMRDNGKTSTYNNLSISINYLPSLSKPDGKFFTVWVLSVNNVLNQKQVYNYNYSYNGLIKTPVQPPANQFFFIGCFISFGIDRTDDVINNNL